ncbi:hypothetical protein VNI00_003738 [Paramarasmius palmivorus]|uniref:CxC2-like cysteine cluster KDZ transposase-associated domain-containing protein n=1 Tax=Paramarasmius palmivorus TaxID=297713 RepID=A0AAW0DTS0_9AGAR
MGRDRHARNKKRFETTAPLLPSQSRQILITNSANRITESRFHAEVPQRDKADPGRQPDPIPDSMSSSFAGAAEMDWEVTPCGDLPMESELYAGEEPGRVKVSLKTKAKRYQDSDNPLITWKEKYRDEYLDGMLITEGRGRHSSHCGCGSTSARFRCLDCFSLQMVCKDCICRQHLLNPLHRIQEWKSGFFHRIPIKEIGVYVHLGHSPGRVCERPQQTQGDFVVLSTTGIHEVELFFCGCNADFDHKQQLLEVGWWPSSYKDPRSAATFDVLRQFHALNLQAQTPPTDFYRTLETLTDGSGLSKPPDRLAQFMIMVRQWRHVKIGKRFGRGHDPSGLKGTEQGSTAVLCRACPQPGINLPLGWEQAPASQRWLYALILAMDANFKQKARSRPRDRLDETLGPGWGCVVDYDSYMSIVNARRHVDEISHCVGFNAIWNANSKKSKGLRATGIGAVICARHELFRPNGIGDLQKGERYCNMDAIFLMSVIRLASLILFISYDIACVGKTDGEGPERKWSTFNNAAASLSMMSHGGRLDTMADQANGHNYEKVIKTGTFLLKKLVKAISESIIHARAFTAINDILRIQFGEHVRLWEKQVEAWEQGLSKECPYDRPTTAISVSRVKKEMAEENARMQWEKGQNEAVAVLANAAAMVIEGIEIEEAQQNVRRLTSLSKQTDFQETNILNRRTALLTRIQRFHKYQVEHIPAIADHIPAITPDDQPEDIVLQLPSTFPTEIRSAIFSKDIIHLEDRLRYAYAHEAIDDLTDHLCSRTVAYAHTTRQPASQGAYTKTRAFRDQIESRVKSSEMSYKRHRIALVSLRGPGDWERVLRELRPDDIRAMGERTLVAEEQEMFRQAQKLAGISEKEIEAALLGADHNVPTLEDTNVLSSKSSSASWIWYVAGDRMNNERRKDIQIGLRVQWCKARARARRSREELELVDEEMRRSITFCHWRAGWWDAQAQRRSDVNPWLAEGLQAYASEQSDIERRRGTSWQSSWAPLRMRVAEVLKSLDDKHSDPEEMLNRLKTVTVELELEEDELLELY